jgi:hypothetical protein
MIVFVTECSVNGFAPIIQKDPPPSFIFISADRKHAYLLRGRNSIYVNQLDEINIL